MVWPLICSRRCIVPYILSRSPWQQPSTATCGHDALRGLPRIMTILEYAHVQPPHPQPPSTSCHLSGVPSAGYGTAGVCSSRSADCAGAQARLAKVLNPTTGLKEEAKYVRKVHRVTLAHNLHASRWSWGEEHLMPGVFLRA